MEYEEFLKRKTISDTPTGIDYNGALNAKLFPWQADIVRWALRRGRAALFEDCGLGKTLQQLAWAEAVVSHTGGRVLILAPLAVAPQTIREGERFGIPVRYCRHQDGVQDGITIANYEMLSKFDPSAFVGVVLDESSILKAFMGKTKRAILDAFRNTPYRLACTATPAPNDYMELGNHSEFLGALPSNDMLSRWFINDTMRAGGYRLKRHAEADFWRWICSWAVCVEKPSDMGGDDADFTLPELEIISRTVESPIAACEGKLIDDEKINSSKLAKVARQTLKQRADAVAEIVASDTDESWLVWCNINDEADAIRAAIPDIVEVRGSDKPERKEWALLGFQDGSIQRLLTKPSIAGYGMNWQHCARMVFCGLSYSYEDIYQSLRRSWRFGQKRPVKAYIITSDAEGAVMASIDRKRKDHESMKRGMKDAMKDFQLQGDLSRGVYAPRVQMKLPKWIA